MKTPMPVLYAIFMLITLAALGLPGLNGFVGEFLILLGVWESHLLDGMAGLFVLAAGLAIVFASVYMLFMFQGTMQEPLEKKFDDVKDLNWKELNLLIPACILVVAIGLYPKPVIDRVSPAVDHILHMEKKFKTFDADSGLAGGH
jgi:NADH-quinone oxidoreductase subunit M